MDIPVTHNAATIRHSLTAARQKMKNSARISSAIILLISSLSVFAGEWNTNKEGVVLDGYDVIAYRDADGAIKGSPSYSAKHDGVTFYFATQEHKEMFVDNPQAYVPKYNGFCAFAIGAKNAKVPANADTFKMYNGELLVFFNDQWDGQKFNTKIPWNNDEIVLFTQAETNWKELN
jgi:YHS domain-containing protein